MLTKEPREAINFRIGANGRDWLDQTGAKYRATRSEVIRAALIIARRHQIELDKVLEERA